MCIFCEYNTKNVSVDKLINVNLSSFTDEVKVRSKLHTQPVGF